MANIIGSNGLKVDKAFDPPYQMLLVDNPGVVMVHAVLPPGGRTRLQYHVNCNLGMYCLKGRRRLFFGPSYQQQESVAEAGDFVFIREGELYSSINDSDTEPAEMIFFYVGISSKDEVKTVFMEPRGK